MSAEIKIYNHRLSKPVFLLLASFFVPFIALGGFLTLAQWFDDLDKPYNDLPRMLFDCFLGFFSAGFFFGIRGLAVGFGLLILWRLARKLGRSSKQKAKAASAPSSDCEHC